MKESRKRKEAIKITLERAFYFLGPIPMGLLLFRKPMNRISIIGLDIL
jgi:hypothetical protein